MTEPNITYYHEFAEDEELEIDATVVTEQALELLRNNVDLNVDAATERVVARAVDTVELVHREIVKRCLEQKREEVENEEKQSLEGEHFDDPNYLIITGDDDARVGVRDHWGEKSTFDNSELAPGEFVIAMVPMKERFRRAFGLDDA